MAEKRLQQRLVVADREDGEMSLHEQIGELEGCVVGEAVHLGVAPDEFNGIELRGVGRQQLGADAPALALEQAFDRFADVRLSPIPDRAGSL
ncbi:MAG TPA: hypothetical protein VMI10_10390 [Terriglobales bacterium]|nr:hypothetical protein [Terriglobales bacterium]HTT21687.1 hypothetical protein [Candidatus Sulfotelmatobacter sp.]